MLAATYREGMQLSFPLLATPKIDGIRGLIIDGKLVSRSLKTIPNVQVRAMLEDILPEGADGEIKCGTFQETTSTVMSRNQTPENLKFFWFDWAYDVSVPYEQRMKKVFMYWVMSFGDKECSGPSASLGGARFFPLMPETIYDMRQLKLFEQYVLNHDDYEGLVVRSPDGVYKSGRSTFSEGLMIKIKAYEDYEAIAIGTEELMHNTNDAFLNNFGHLRRNSRKDGKVPGDTLGAIIVKTPENIVFKIGTGYTAEERKTIWSHRDELIGRYIKYRCVATNKHDVPRSAVFLGVRSLDDM